MKRDAGNDCTDEPEMFILQTWNSPPSPNRKTTSKPGTSDWGVVFVAALVMLATLPGRTQGLGLITEPLIGELKLDRVQFANFNLWATLIGALFCFPAGWLIDRFGLRWTTAALTISLALVVWRFSVVAASSIFIFILLTATRAIGQSALSVASITAVGKRFQDKVGMPMAVFAILLSIFFAVAFGLIGYSIRAWDWRTAWFQVAGVLVLVIAPLIVGFLREKPGSNFGKETSEVLGGFTLNEAFKTGAFWIFAGAAALFNLVSSGLGLFNEAVLLESGFDRKTFHLFLVVTTLLSLGGQFLCGWLSRRFSYRTLIGVAMLFYAGGLAGLPLSKSVSQLFILAGLLGLAGGMIIVVFFAIWSEVFGRARLGRIQGAAQCLTVISSALGPVLFATWHEMNGSYSPLLYTIAVVVIVVGLIAMKVPLPSLKNVVEERQFQQCSQ